jgi:hypothetical protein
MATHHQDQEIQNMSTLKATFGGVLAACALGAVASAAQAAIYLVEGSEVTAPTNIKHTEESSTTNTLKGTPFGVSTEIRCTHRVILEASIGAAGTGGAKIEFSSCTVAKPANCTVKEPVTSKVNTTLEEPSSGVFENKFAPESGPFAEIGLEGASCSLKSSPFPVEGTQKCELPSGGTEAVTHELTCKAGGSSLTAGGKAATFESSAATLELESGKKWSAHGGLAKKDYDLANFPVEVVNEAGKEGLFTIENTGDEEFTFTLGGFSGEGAGEYKITDTKGCLTKNFLKTESCDVTVKMLNMNAKKATYTGDLKWADGSTAQFKVLVKHK